MILRASLKLDTVNKLLGDVDSDDAVNSGDALAVLRWSLNMKDDANAKVGTEIEIPA